MIYDKSVTVMAVKVYNHLPKNIKNVNDKIFKTTLKNWLINNTFYNLNEYFTVTTLR